MTDKATKINLRDGWSIEADASCWALKETRQMKNVKAGNPDTYANSHYYPTLEFGLKAFIDHKAKEFGGNSKDDAVKIVKAIEQVGRDIKEALEKHVKINGKLTASSVLDR